MSNIYDKMFDDRDELIRVFDIPETQFMVAAILGRETGDSSSPEVQYAANGLINSARFALNSGELFLVGVEMSAIIEDALNDLPKVTLQPHDLPSPSGLVKFLQPIELNATETEDSPSFSMNVTYILWDAILPDGNPAEEGIVLWWWSEQAELNNLREVLMPDKVELLLGQGHSLSDATEMTDDAWRNLLQRMPKFIPLSTITLQYGVEYDLPSVSLEDPSNENTLMLSMFTFWMMCNQQAVKQRDERPSRHARRRAQRANHDRPNESVRVVYLPGLEGHSESYTDSKGRLRVRFPVRGHWRNQPYPSLGITKPIWIAPYVKGPTDAPFQSNKHLNVLKPAGTAEENR